MFQVEKFTKNDKSGYKITGTFASSKNHNGAYFDPVEIFAVDNPPKKLNLAHEDYTTDYSTGTNVSVPVASIANKLLKFEWQVETTNENFVKLIDEDNFGGFSPELYPKNQPIKSETGERFYRSGDLYWDNTAILKKGQKAGFHGANEAKVEKFEAFEDVVIKEEFEVKNKQAENKKNKKNDDYKPKNRQAKKEQFYFWASVGQYVKYNSAIYKVVKSEVLEGQEYSTYILRDMQGKELQIQDSKDLKINSVTASDVLEYILEKENKDEELEKFEKLEKEIEKFNQKLKAKGQVATVESFSKGHEKEPKSTTPADSTIQNLIKKIF